MERAILIFLIAAIGIYVWGAVVLFRSDSTALDPKWKKTDAILVYGSWGVILVGLLLTRILPADFQWAGFAMLIAGNVAYGRFALRGLQRAAGNFGCERF
ncbi:MAG TPA: hypothetical protein VG125_08700 [Pirellulales bacterium]|jgi:hypothetical protein|nr:hypothetical protein [Pirellulales bacterium]